MSRVRFSIAGLMCISLLIGLAMTALFAASELLASLIYTFSLGMLGGALVGAVLARPATRPFWLGYAVFGWMYVAAVALTSTPGNTIVLGSARLVTTRETSLLVTDRILDQLATVRGRLAIGTKVMAPWTTGTFYAGKIKDIKDGQYLIDWDDSSPDLWVSASKVEADGEQFRRTGHAVFGILIAIAAGQVCLWVIGGDRETASHAEDKAKEVEHELEQETQQETKETVS